ncbi:MAG: C40 family peptidase [Actinomycetota bacterium]|nr:C40 family peptidase [Actinomycetota bacterium]
MTRTQRAILSLLTAAIFGSSLPAAHAAQEPLPEWVRPAVRYLVDNGYMEREGFRPNQAMTRAAFKQLMKKAFGGGYSRDEGDVTAGEVAAALVRQLGQAPVATKLSQATSPDGWDPGVGKRFGSEIVARELGLRRDRPTTEETHDAAANEAMRQGDVAWAVWKAKTAPSIYGADALNSFQLANYSETRRQVVKFALSLVGAPYVWGGEWPSTTPSGYPYGAQAQGGFDCSGFIWYVMQKKTSSFAPLGRSYEGWAIPERSSYDMAGAIGSRKRLGLKELKPADLVFFAPDGRDAKASSVYHAGLYLGNGWMIHSSGGRAGISLAQISAGSWWNDQFAWGRRIIT